MADNIITTEQAKKIESRARETMVYIAINTILCFGIIAATLGLIFWLASALAVAISGTAMLLTGLFILKKGGELFRMFGNAATLIGAGMLLGGVGIELIDKYESIAGWTMLAGGLAVVAVAGWAFLHGALGARFVSGAIMLMGLAMHLTGCWYLLDKNSISGLPISLFYLYATATIIAAGWRLDVRLVTALAIVPFAQALETGTLYFHAAYVFYSPETTLSILQMGLLIGICLYIARITAERDARHARILAILAFIVANLCALVGSLWGDVVGETIWGPGYRRPSSGVSWEEWRELKEAFKLNALVLSEQFYSIVWALALAAMVFWAAFKNQRGLFNAALTFGAIHAYTQAFETFGEKPLIFVIGGLGAVALAWIIWRLNHWLMDRSQ